MSAERIATRVPSGGRGLGTALLRPGFAVRAAFALPVANARYWTGIAPTVRRELRHWESRAIAIPDRDLQGLALAKLRDERFNAQVAATLAVTCPRRRRDDAVRAIVAYEVMYDYLDGLTERPSEDPLGEGLRLYGAFFDAVDPEGRIDESDVGDGGYLAELAEVVRDRFAALPARDAVAGAALKAARRCGEAQVRVNATPSLGGAQIELWARREASKQMLPWREFLAGAAASVLGVHALIAAAADARTTPAQAEQLERAYLSIAALSTMLDGLIDLDGDADGGQPGYLAHCPDRAVLAEDLAVAARRAAGLTRALPNAPHHQMTLTGVVAYYTSARAASRGDARPVTRRIQRELWPLIVPTLAVMRAWRLAKGWRGGGGGG